MSLDNSPHDRVIASLEAVPFLQDLDPQILEPLARGSSLRHYGAGEVICEQGEAGDCLYIVEEGEVEIFLPLQDGGRTSLVTLHRGQFFGEMALIDEQPRSASAAARQPTQIRTVDRESFRHFLFANPDAVVRLMMHLSSIIREANRQLASARER
jgi:CRP/FNR family transcriptional regulator, cyclic AMP receptor protein